MTERLQFALSSEYQQTEAFALYCADKMYGAEPAIQPAAELFISEFVHCYSAAHDERIRRMIGHKVEHTGHVRHFTRDVALQSLNPADPWNMDLVDTIAVLHDIYRARQALVWKTFSDRKSIAHAHEGAELIRGVWKPWGLYGFSTEQVADPIYTHSDRMLTTNNPYSQVIQDGDKLALLHWFEEIANVDEHQPWDGTSVITPKILEDFLNGEVTDNVFAETAADRIVNRLSWWYGLHFPAARELALEYNVLQGPLDALKEAMGSVPEQILERVDQWRTNPHGK